MAMVAKDAVLKDLQTYDPVERTLTREADERLEVYRKTLQPKIGLTLGRDDMLLQVKEHLQQCLFEVDRRLRVNDLPGSAIRHFKRRK